MKSSMEIAAKELEWMINTSNANMRQIPGPVYNVMGYGAKGDGVTDDTEAIQKAINEAEEAGGGTVYFPKGSFVSSSLMIQNHNVNLVGEGCGGYSNGIASLRNTAATRLVFKDNEGVFIHFKTPAGNVIKSGGGISNLMIDCQNRAYTGLQLTTWTRGLFERVVIYGATQHQINITTTNETLAAEPYDCYRNQFRDVFTTCKNLQGNTSQALRLGSGGGKNSCYNSFEHCWFDAGEDLNTETTPTVKLENTDNNIFYHCATAHLAFCSSDDDSSGNEGASRYNYVLNSEIGRVVARASQHGGTSSHHNVVLGLNNSNNAGRLTVQNGSNGAENAHLIALNTEGFLTRLLFNSISVGGEISDQELLKIVGDDRNGTGRLWVKTGSAGQNSPLIRVTGARHDSNNWMRFSGRLALDSYTTSSPITNKHLGAVLFGGSVEVGNEDSVVYPAIITARASGQFNSANDCPTNIELRAGNFGGTLADSDSSFPPVVASVKANGCVNFTPLSNPPASADKGDVYFDSSLNKLRVYNGASWDDL